MKKYWTAVSMAILIICAGFSPLRAEGADYSAPDGAFALRAPDGWQVQRSAIGDAGWATTFTRGTAHIAVLSFRSAEDLNPAMLDSAGGALMNASLEEIALHGTIFSKALKKASAQVQGASATAIRCDLEFSAEESGSARRKGCMLALLGRRVVVLTAISAPLADVPGYTAAEEALRTLALESRSPPCCPWRRRRPRLQADLLSRRAVWRDWPKSSRETSSANRGTRSSWLGTRPSRTGRWPLSRTS